MRIVSSHGSAGSRGGQTTAVSRHSSASAVRRSRSLHRLWELLTFPVWLKAASLDFRLDRSSSGASMRAGGKSVRIAGT
jgi:hypothetical protein